MTNIQTIIWDWNGTLLNDLNCCIEIMNIMLKKRSLSPITKTHYQNNFSFPVIKYYEKVGFNFKKESFTKVSEEFIALYRKKSNLCSLQPDALKIIKQFKNQGIQQVILSAILNMVKHYKIDAFFDYIYGATNFLAESKQQRAIELLEKLKTPPTNICLIGDTTHDIEIANHIGSKIVIVSHGHHPAGRLKKHQIPVLNSLSELPQFIVKNPWLPIY